MSKRDECVYRAKDYHAEREEREDIRERSDRKREDRGRHPEKRVSAYREENHNRPRSMWSSLQTVQLG